MQDEFYIKHLKDVTALGPILDVLLRSLPRDNLLCSACLDLFELIKKENLKELVRHLVETQREKVAALSYLETFRDLLIRYDQTQGYTTNMDSYFIESEDDVVRRPPNAGARGLMEHIAVDPVEEEYWNTSDDEDENVKPASGSASVNGTPASAKPLVDYASDEEPEENGDAIMSPASSEDDRIKANKSDEDDQSPKIGVINAKSPPERLSEKRRREDDEDDELGKLMQNKRRNSSSAGHNAGTTTALRKKKSFASNRDSGGNGPKKIAISISPALKAAAGQGSPQQDEST